MEKNCRLQQLGLELNVHGKGTVLISWLLSHACQMWKTIIEQVIKRRTIFLHIHKMLLLNQGEGLRAVEATDRS